MYSAEIKSKGILNKTIWKKEFIDETHAATYALKWLKK